MRYQGAGGESVVVNHSVVHLMLSFKRVCSVAVACPVVAIVICLLTGIIFQAEDVHETHCRVYNVIPSISAITGISPQRYLWRISVALHIGPRFLIAALYKAHNENILNTTPETKIHLSTRKWISIAFWFHIIEIGALCGVTFISNRENYPIHEKLFITFMMSSLTHMLANIQVSKKVAEITEENCSAKQTIVTLKQGLFVLSVISTAGLILFFLEHRYFCHEMAFSWFAFCEYVIASANMIFHLIAVIDFPTEQLMIAKSTKHVDNFCINEKNK